MNERRTIIGKHALLLAAKGKVELAAQVFVYDHIREIRVDLEQLEVKLLMDYDDSYFRIFKINLENDSNDEVINSKRKLLNFYNDLLNASMKFSKEDMDNLRKQQENSKQQVLENKKILEQQNTNIS